MLKTSGRNIPQAAGRSRYVPLLMLVFVNLLWAAQYPAFKIAGGRMPPAVLGFWVLLGASLLLWPVLIRERVRPGAGSGSRWDRRAPFEFLTLAVLGVLPPSVLMAWGIARSTASNASILSLTIPVLMSALGVVLLGERITRLRIYSLAIALIGTALISCSDFSARLLSVGDLPGNAMILTACAGSAFYNVYGKRLLRRFSGLEVLLYGDVAAMAGCLGIVLAAGEAEALRPTAYGLDVWCSVAVLAALSWGLAMVAWMWVLERVEASRVSVSIYLLPLFGVLLSAAALGERLEAGQCVGAVLILAGTYLVTVHEADMLPAG